jgi:trk system potassium uptake protein TrkH
MSHVRRRVARSTGGGVKTTTFAVLLTTIVHTLRERSIVTLIDREIPLEIIRKSLTIVILSIMWIILGVVALCALEPFKTEQIAFEVVSAFGTVGFRRVSPRNCPVSANCSSY